MHLVKNLTQLQCISKRGVQLCHHDTFIPPFPRSINSLNRNHAIVYFLFSVSPVLHNHLLGQFESRLSDRCAGPVGKHSCCNVHGLKFLEQQLGSIGNVDLGNLGLVFTRSAFERLL